MGSETPGERVLVTGGRDYADSSRVDLYLDCIHGSRGIAVVIHGACKKNGKLSGADRWADEWARRNGVAVIPCPADWQMHGRAAGPIRNSEMLDHHRPTLCVALPGGNGTADMVRKAKAARVEVIQDGVWREKLADLLRSPRAGNGP